MTETLARSARAGRTRRALIDCDIHNSVPADALQPYLAAEWRDYEREIGGRGPSGRLYPKGYANAARADAFPPNGRPPGGDLPFLREQLLDAWGIDYGVLNCLHGGGGQLNARWGAAQCQAVNDWQVAEWLDPEPRLRASIVVHPGDPEAAAREVERCARDRRFVQVLLTVRTAEPLGKPRYWPLYAAAAEHGLPVGIHFGGPAPNPITPTGWPSYYLEDHSGMMLAFQAQVASFVYEGAFQRFPDLRVVLIEGGFAWLPPLMWRMDHYWREFRAEMPWLTEPPSEVVRRCFRVTAQPMDEPTDPKDFPTILRQLGSDEMLMFATDYPHWDFDSPDHAFPIKLPAEVERKILADNARAFYRL
jgi:predicted TIM-barrel fold metal-dependent hydrolase